MLLYRRLVYNHGYERIGIDIDINGSFEKENKIFSGAKKHLKM